MWSGRTMLHEPVIATLGEVHPQVLSNYEINARAYVAQINLSLLLKLKKEGGVYKPLPKFPAVLRDFALLCDKEIPVGKLEEIMKNTAGALCENVELFDVYEGAQIPEGKKSVAFSIKLRATDRTLTDEEIEKVSQKIIKKLEETGVSLRK